MSIWIVVWNKPVTLEDLLRKGASPLHLQIHLPERSTSRALEQQVRRMEVGGLFPGVLDVRVRERKTKR